MVGISFLRGRRNRLLHKHFWKPLAQAWRDAIIRILERLAEVVTLAAAVPHMTDRTLPPQFCFQVRVAVVTTNDVNTILLIACLQKTLLVLTI